MFGPKACEGGEKDDVKKDNPEYVAPTPEKTPEANDSIDIAMAHQYCKRMGFKKGIEEDGAIAKYLQDRTSYSTVKDKYALHLGFDSSMSTDEQMALLATVRGDIKNYSNKIDDIIAGKEVGVATLGKIRTALAEWHREGVTIQNTTPEKYTKQTGTQSIEVSKDKLAQQTELAGFVAQAKGGNTH